MSLLCHPVDLDPGDDMRCDWLVQEICGIWRTNEEISRALFQSTGSITILCNGDLQKPQKLQYIHLDQYICQQCLVFLKWGGLPFYPTSLVLFRQADILQWSAGAHCCLAWVSNLVVLDVAIQFLSGICLDDDEKSATEASRATFATGDRKPSTAFSFNSSSIDVI